LGARSCEVHFTLKNRHRQAKARPYVPAGDSLLGGDAAYPKSLVPLPWPPASRNTSRLFSDENCEVFVSKWLSDRIVEEAGRRMYESQQSRLSDQTTFAAKRAWRSDDLPEKFWDSYIEDARAALSLTSIAGAYRVVRDER
jgi:hypothetical protein